jgi:hypothetical protein
MIQLRLHQIFFIRFSLWLPLFFLLMFINGAVFSQESLVPYRVSSALFDTTKPNDLGLTVPAGAETITIVRPSNTSPHYCLGVVLIPFNGYLYAQWQTSARDEDSPDTWVAFSRSKDGRNWTMPVALVPRYVHETMHTSGGWWTDGKTLTAYINVWTSDTTQPKGGCTEYITSNDGIQWTDPKPLLDNHDKPIHGIIEQDVRAMSNKRIITAFHEQPGLIVSPYYTDDPHGIRGWTKGVMQHLPFQGTTSRELEPSWFYKPNGTLVMVFRDQQNTFRQLASISSDTGKTWTTPVVTNMPDSRAKQSAGNFQDGTAFLINCPSGNKTRFPLVITLSKDGEIFDTAFALRTGGANLPPLRYDGKYKRAGYHYPKSVIWNGFVYVAYATNKEDVEITRVPLLSLKY